MKRESLLCSPGATGLAKPSAVPTLLPKLGLLDVPTNGDAAELRWQSVAQNALPKLGLPDMGISSSSSSSSPFGQPLSCVGSWKPPSGGLQTSSNVLPKQSGLPRLLLVSPPEHLQLQQPTGGARARAKQSKMKAACTKWAKKKEAHTKQSKVKVARKKQSKVEEVRARQSKTEEERHAKEVEGSALAFRTASGVLINPGSSWSKLMGLNLLSSELPAGFGDSSNHSGEHGDVRDDVMEMFAPPRLLRVTPEYGLKGAHSIDLQTGYDLKALSGQARVSSLLASKNPHFLMTCPPCHS